MATRILLAALASALLATTAACSGATETADAASATSTTPPTATVDHSAGPSTEQPWILTDELLQAWARGLKKEAELLRAPGRATHYGVMISARDEEGAQVLEAAGIPANAYGYVARTAGPVLSVLNARGELGPKLIHFDPERSSDEIRQRLGGDPYHGLPPESAEALRRNLELLEPLWLDVTGITAEHG